MRQHRKELVLQPVCRFGLRTDCPFKRECKLLLALDAGLVSDIASNLRVTAELIGLDRRGHAAAIDFGAVGAHVPALVFDTAGLSGALPLAQRRARFAIVGKKDEIKRLASHFTFRIAENTLRAAVPRDDQTLHEIG